MTGQECEGGMEIRVETSKRTRGKSRDSTEGRECQRLYMLVCVYNRKLGTRHCHTCTKWYAGSTILSQAPKSQQAAGKYHALYTGTHEYMYTVYKYTYL